MTSQVQLNAVITNNYFNAKIWDTVEVILKQLLQREDQKVKVQGSRKLWIIKF